MSLEPVKRRRRSPWEHLMEASKFAEIGSSARRFAVVVAMAVAALQDDGRLTLGKVQSGGVNSSLAITDANNFHHVAVTKSGSSVVFYVDGIAEQGAPYNPGFSFSTAVAIGARGDDLSGSLLGWI